MSFLAISALFLLYIHFGKSLWLTWIPCNEASACRVSIIKQQQQQQQQQQQLQPRFVPVERPNVCFWRDFYFLELGSFNLDRALLFKERQQQTSIVLYIELKFEDKMPTTIHKQFNRWAHAMMKTCCKRSHTSKQTTGSTLPMVVTVVRVTQ